MSRTVRLLGGVLTALAVVLLLVWYAAAPEPGQQAGLGTGPSATSPTAAAPATTPAARSASAAPTKGTGARCVPPATGADGLAWVCLSTLPRQAQQTADLIARGGPFPYAKDGATFNNFEGVLPDRRRGYYREYTVRTPGERDRGARRIVTGNADRELFYTADHYDTFVRVQR